MESPVILKQCRKIHRTENLYNTTKWYYCNVSICVGKYCLGTDEQIGDRSPASEHASADLIASFEPGDARIVRDAPEDFKRNLSYFDLMNRGPFAITIR